MERLTWSSPDITVTFSKLSFGAATLLRGTFRGCFRSKTGVPSLLLPSSSLLSTLSFDFLAGVAASDEEVLFDLLLFDVDDEARPLESAATAFDLPFSCFLRFAASSLALADLCSDSSASRRFSS